MFLSTTRSDVHVSLSFLVKLRIESLTLSCPQSNGWLVFVKASGRNQTLKFENIMLDYVIDLLDDATDFSWGSAKASHAVLLCRMEQDWKLARK